MPEKKTKAIRSSSNPSSYGPKGRSLFLGIGINEYQHFDPLHNAVKDINDVASLLEERYELDEKILLLNEKATKDNITNHLEDLADLAAPEDKVIIYYSGHGFLREETGYWIPVDAQPGRRGQFIRNEVIRGCIKDVQARHILPVSNSPIRSIPVRVVFPAPAPPLSTAAPHSAEPHPAAIPGFRFPPAEV